MAQNRSVLQALKILGPEEMLKLSEVLQVKQMPLKKAAGADYIVWEDSINASGEDKSRAPQKTAKILPFPKKHSVPTEQLATPVAEAAAVEDEISSLKLMESEVILWQRDHARTTDEILHKQEALKGYKKATEVYTVKSLDLNGNEKIRFANTNGILIDKKQA